MQIRSTDINPEQTYKLLTGIVVPRPIAWVSTRSTAGLINLAPFSCYTIVSNKPPMIGINIGRKAGVRKDTSRHIHETGEFVVNIGDDTLIDAIHQSAVEHPPEISEAALLGLELIKGQAIAVPRLAIAPISMECRLHSVTPFGDTGAEFHVGEIMLFHVRDDLLHNGKIDTAQLRPIARLAGPNYATLGEIISIQPIAQTPNAINGAKVEPQ
jgi:flavin reductase (DIM6/NTAB) family NADH-FMN oxidoreductase RutF